MNEKPVGQRELAAYFIPLALQIFSQGITHNLVAMVASSGPDGALGFAGLAQANRINFFLGSFSAGLLTAGMVYGRTRKGHGKFSRVTLIIIAGLTTVHCLLNLPPVSRFLFYKVMGLPPVIARNAQSAFLLAIPVQFLFALRLPAFASLFLHHATLKAYGATIVRILATLGMSAVFVRIGLVGVEWAMLCMIAPVVLEVIGLTALAAPYVRGLPDDGTPVPGALTMIAFAGTFSIGKVLVAFSDWIMAGLVARAPDPERVLPVYSVVTVVVGPIAVSATRMQAMVVAFADRERGPQRRFVVTAGLILGLLPFVMQIPLLAQWYFLGIQHIPPGDLGLIRWTGLALLPFPLLVGLRSFAEGRAAVQKKPMAVLAGETTYLASMISVGTMLLFAGAPGYVIGPAGIFVGNIAAWLMTLAYLSTSWVTVIRKAVPFLPVREG